MACKVEADVPAGPACLKNIDALLQCPICFDFLNVSMMTKCSHNFCSLCIRKFLSYKLQCPVCNMQMTEQDLRNNRLLDELVEHLQAARQQLSKAIFETPPISPKNLASVVKCKTPRGRGPKCDSSVLSHFFQKKPKTPQSKVAKSSVKEEPTSTTQSLNANDPDPHSKQAPLSVAVKEEPPDMEDSGIEIAHSSSPSNDVKPVIKVECPVCSVGVSQQFINKHLDTCLTRDEKKGSLRSSLTRRRPMGKLVYNLLSVQELKRKLKECHLSVQGSRDQMIKRHRAFVLSYNAQCDSLNPKSAEDIAKEVEADEKMRNQLQGKPKPVMTFSKTQSEEEIDEVHSNYRKQHSSDFSRLIAQVRGRLETTRQTHAKQKVTAEKQDAPVTHSADHVGESEISPVIKMEEEASDEEKPVRGMEAPPSPTYSDVSISSSLSDIFGPEPARNLEDQGRSPAQKRTSSSREDDVTSAPVLRKRQRKS